jgi:predicted acylesterase/phospholipase RssA
MFIDRSPLANVLESFLRPAAVSASSKILRIAVTEWTSGELRIFGNHDMTDEAAVIIVLASTAIPGFFPPVELGGEVYVDGGVTMDTPLLPAIQAGARVIHAIYLDPEVANIPVETIRTTFGAFDRTLTIGRARAINLDMDTARRVNQGLDLLERFRTGSAAETVQSRAVVEAARATGFASSDGGPYKKIEIHRYHPRGDIGGIAGVLNADHERVRGQIEKGFADAVNHDWEQAGCVL